MYFDFDEYRPQPARLISPVSTREGVLVSVIVHLVMVIALILSPGLFSVDRAEVEARQAELLRQQREREREAQRFVFVQPRLDRPAPAPPPRAELSDQDRVATAPERAPNPTNPLPFSRGNSAERIDADELMARRERQPPLTPPTGPPTDRAGTSGSTDESGTLLRPSGEGPLLALPEAGSDSRARRNDGEGLTLGDTLRNLQRLVEDEALNNPQGGGGRQDPYIQFDTKGVEFGPWLRRFVAQVKRNWFVPYAAMALKGHTAITFNVHRNGALTDLAVVQPSAVDAFTNAAYNALVASNPTQPLPPEYPDEKAFFTVTFYYNETPAAP